MLLCRDTFISEPATPGVTPTAPVGEVEDPSISAAPAAPVGELEDPFISAAPAAPVPVNADLLSAGDQVLEEKTAPRRSARQSQARVSVRSPTPPKSKKKAKKAKKAKKRPRPKSPEPSVEEELDYPERIVGSSIIHGEEYFRIKWQNFDTKHNTWEKASNFVDDEDFELMVTDFRGRERTARMEEDKKLRKAKKKRKK